MYGAVAEREVFSLQGLPGLNDDMEEIVSDHRDPRIYARFLFWTGWKVAAIARELGISAATIHSWKRRDKWRDVDPSTRMAATVEHRYLELIAKDKKSSGDYKEIDSLGRELERLERIKRYSNGGTATDLNPKLANRYKDRKAPEKNPISDEQAALLIKIFKEELFEYQRVWYEAGQKYRIRNILKSRQIGATYYFAREALVDALETGRNQIFLSASKSQAYQFRSYIVAFAKEAGITLKGDPILLPNGAELRFVSTNSSTAQSYHGNLYVDEYFWLPKFAELRKAAAGMASHAKWRLTYFSTPSTLTHQAYPFWSGNHFNKGRAKADHIHLDVSHSAMAAGRMCEDGQWRQIVTVEDAEKGGCTLFDINGLRLENSPLEFEQLYMAQFIDDADSVFPLSMLQPCMVDSWTIWEDYRPGTSRPLGNRPVWIGYDPSETGDAAGCIVLAPPLVNGGTFRILEKFQWHGMDFDAQAGQILALTRRYNVTFIGIDTTGMGTGVYQLVKKFFPTVVGYHYSPEVKNRLVLKAYDVVKKGRLQFDAGWTDLAAAFMAIRRTMTKSGKFTTFEASRSEEVSHADLAWATMHALLNEPLEGIQASEGSMEIY